MSNSKGTQDVFFYNYVAKPHIKDNYNWPKELEYLNSNGKNGLLWRFGM